MINDAYTSLSKLFNLVNTIIIINRILWESEEKRGRYKIRIQNTGHKKKVAGVSENQEVGYRGIGNQDLLRELFQSISLMVRFNAPYLLFYCFALMLSCRIFA